jgi:hypothetical protein
VPWVRIWSQFGAKKFPSGTSKYVGFGCLQLYIELTLVKIMAIDLPTYISGYHSDITRPSLAILTKTWSNFINAVQNLRVIYNYTQDMTAFTELKYVLQLIVHIVTITIWSTGQWAYLKYVCITDIMSHYSYLACISVSKWWYFTVYHHFDKDCYENKYTHSASTCHPNKIQKIGCVLSILTWYIVWYPESDKPKIRKQIN